MREAPGTNLEKESKSAHVGSDLKRPGDLLAYKLYQIRMSPNKILSTQNLKWSSLSDDQKRKKGDGQMEIHK